MFISQERISENLPGGPVVKISPSNSRGMSSIPGQGTKFPHASGCGKFKFLKKNLKERISEAMVKSRETYLSTETSAYSEFITYIYYLFKKLNQKKKGFYEVPSGCVYHKQ